MLSNLSFKSLWKCYLKKCLEVKFILTDLLKMFPQFQNIFPYFLPSLYLSSAASELFIGETEKSWNIYPSCSFNSFVSPMHIRSAIGKRRCSIESSFQKTTYPSHKTHPPKLIWQTEQLYTTSLFLIWLYSNT